MISLNSILIFGKNKISDIQINSGQKIGIFGGANSGKSSVLLAILGQSINLCSFMRCTNISNSEIAYIPTNIPHLFSGMKSTLRGEMKLSAQFLGRKIPAIDPIAKRFDVENLLNRNPFDLSGGEMVRAALAINAVKKPKLWLLDQVYDFLHPDSAKEINTLMLNEVKKGFTVVETHSTMPPWADDFNYRIILEKGKYIDNGFLNDYKNKKRNKFKIYNNKIIQQKNLICSISNIVFQYKNGSFRLGPISTNFMENDIVAITGPNGSGKTTLLQCIANLNEGVDGTISIQGNTPPKERWLWARKAFYCFQNPDDQLYQSSVLNEITNTIKALGRMVPIDIEEQLSAFGLKGYLEAEPYQLPRPFRRMVCLAAALLSGSPVILLDEPTANLDYRLKEIIFDQIYKLANNGSVIVIVSHDLPFISAIANKVLTLSNGKLED